MPSSPWWALVPAGSIVVVVFGIEALPDSADALAWLALLTVPPLAAFALGDLVHGSQPWWALAAVPLFAIAWLAQGSLAGEVAGSLLSGLACLALGWLLVCVVPGHWLRWGIYAMAAIDAVLIAAELLQGPSGVLVAADPGGLPRLQVLEFGTARMGFGDAFVAATAGCLLAASPPKGLGQGLRRPRSARRQRDGAILAAVLGLAFDLLFFVLDTLPATVPIAVALALVEWRDRGEASAGMAQEGDAVYGGETGHGQRDPQP